MTEKAKPVVIRSSRYGEFTAEPQQIYRFERGLIGIPEPVQYALVPFGTSPFSILHALDRDLSFILLPAAQLGTGYEFTIDSDVVELLQAKQPEDLSVMLVVNVLESRLHVNLKAPVLIHPSLNRGCQYLITDRDYPIRYPLAPEERAVCSS